jgi:type I phosphodiesterase/nucleotide pyrophosphatase
MRSFRDYFLSTAAIAGVLSSQVLFAAASRADDDHSVRHVLLLSIDGFHQHDLASCMQSGACPTLARLAGRGVTFTNARTTTPSDSFPGMLAQLTGGTPRTTGVYYDDSYDRTLFSPDGKFPASPTGCSGNPGTEVVLDESIDFDSTKLFSGGINPAFLPQQRHADGSCTKVFPHDFVKVNTVFGVAHQAGLQTAWSDKHPAYDIVNGPFVGTPNVDDLYTPEINSNIFTATPPGPASANGVDLAGPAGKCDATNSTFAFGNIAPVQYVDCAPTQEAYDDVKVNAVINWINGKRAEGQPWTGRAPGIFGMNFQAISVTQKLVAGGYDAQLAPKPILTHAIMHTDASIGRMVAALKARDLLEDTLIIVSAKHGQSPIDPTTLQMEAKATQAPDHTVVDPGPPVINAPVDQTFSAFTNPNSGNQYAQGGHLQTDDVGIVWLQPNTRADVKQAVVSLQNNAKAIHADKLPPATIFDSNISSGDELSDIFGDPRVPGSIAAARAPDIFIQPDHGVIYSGSKKKIAEHGGGSLDDTHVALLVAGPSVDARKVDDLVHTTQIAPTILRALGLPPQALKSVREEGTRVLPDLFGRDDE